MFMCMFMYVLIAPSRRATRSARSAPASGRSTGISSAPSRQGIITIYDNANNNTQGM